MIQTAYTRVLAATVVCMVVLSFSANGADWTQFRGGNGVSNETGLPVKWSKSENIRWKVALPGRGLSCPVVADGRVFVTACDGPEQTRLHVLCLDAASGKKLWQRSIWATGNTLCHPKTNMAAPTPATDGKAVYAMFATADVVAYDRDGNLLWYRSLLSDYPAITNQVGMASSPVLAGSVLVVPMENAGESFLAGIDVKTGKNKWKVERPRDINWVTPAVRVAGKQSEVIFQGQKEVVAYDADTGNRRWSYAAAEGNLSTIPSPVIGAKNDVLIPAGDLISLKPGAEEETPALNWKSTRLKSGGFATPLYYQKRIYTLNAAGVLICGDAKTGKMVWDLRLRGPIAASPIAADGRLYIVNEKGLTQVVKLGDKPVIEANNDLGDDMLATPAIANGCIFLRSDGWLYCMGK